MKFYKSVIKKAEEKNYKKGVVRIDTKSGYYRYSKVLYYISLAWFMVFHLSYIFSNAMAYFFYEQAAKNIHTQLFITSLIVLVLLVAGFVCLKLKYHIAAACLTVVGGVSQLVALGSNENVSLAFLNHGVLGNKFFWFHYAPAGLIIIFIAIACFVGVKSHIQFKKDYKKAMASMFESYLAENPNASDVEWQEYLEEMDKREDEAK
jgi:hypothetical protein